MINRYSCGLAEVKFAPTEEGHAESMTFSGYGAVFGNVDSHGDVIVKGAFSETLAKSRDTGVWPAMLVQHGGWEAESWMPVGVWTELREDDNGLYVEGQLADTPRGQEVYKLLKMDPRPAINGLSVGIFLKEFERGRGDEPRFTIKKADLMEISLVTFPANGRARVDQVKSELTKRDLERVLRDAGLSRSEAKAVLAKGYDALSLRDAADSGVDELAAMLRRNIENLKTQ